MRIILFAKQTIVEYAIKNSQSRVSFGVWLKAIKLSEWNIPNDITSAFKGADLLGKGTERVVFNIGGNKYRLLCKYYFGKSRVQLYIKWIGTHAEYTKLCKEGKQYSISIY